MSDAYVAFLFVGNTAAAAVDESTTMANERRLAETTTADGGDTMSDASGGGTTSAASRNVGLGTMLLALLAFLFVGNTAAVDESTTMANERRLAETTTADGGDTTSDASGGDTTSAASRWIKVPVFTLAAALGLAARR